MNPTLGNQEAVRNLRCAALVIVPITLGRGVSLWEGSSGLEDRFTVESVASPSGLTHQLWNKNDHA